MPYVIPSPQSSPPNKNDYPLPSPSSSISFRLGSSESEGTPTSSQSSSRSGSEDEEGTPDSSPPTPDTKPKLPWLGAKPSKEIKLETAYTEDIGRPFRNHIRSQSMDQIHTLTRFSRAGDQGGSPVSSLIFLQPAVQDENDDFPSAPSSTIWPEGESTDFEVSPLNPHSVLWSPPPVETPDSAFQFSSRTTTPKPTQPGQSVLHAVRQRPSLSSSASVTSDSSNQTLRIDTARARARSSSGSSPLPTPMVRKKSGELVRSSLKQHSRTPSEVDESAIRQVNAQYARTEVASPHAQEDAGRTRAARAKSAPATPTGPKAVHFDKQLEHVKLFLAQQRPAAVSRQGSPGETTEEESEAYPFPPMFSEQDKINLILPNFPVPAPSTSCGKDVFLQGLDIDQAAKCLRGTVTVRNLSFHKRVVVRFTCDDWQTVSETTADWQASLDGGHFDQWQFRIKLQDMLARIEEKRLFLVIKYTVDGRDLWDNNDGRNYAIQFKREIPTTRLKAVGPKRQSQYQWAVTTENQATERMADLRRELDRLVSDETRDLPIAQGSLFGHRYDFGNSLRQQPMRREDSNIGLTPAANIPATYFFTPPTPTGAPPLQMPQPQPRYAQFEVDGVLHKDYGMPSQPAAYSGLPSQSSLFNGEPWPPGENMSARRLDPNAAADYPPALTPRMFEDGAPLDAAAASPAVSPRSQSPDLPRRPLPADRRARSPPPRRASPDLSTPPSSDASYASPQSPTRSGSPDTEAHLLKRSLPKLASSDESMPSYSGFLERYCFFQPSQHAPALGMDGLTGQDAATPRASTNGHFQQDSSASSVSVSPTMSPTYFSQSTLPQLTA